MATTFLFPLTEAVPVTPPSPGAEWEHQNNVTRKLITSADASTLTNTAYSPDAPGDHLVNADSLHRQYVSDALAAQTISGNVTGQFQCFQGDDTDNLSLTLVIKVISNDGTTTRATLLAITRAGTGLTITTATNRTYPSTALSNYTCIEGDRLLVEVGVGGTPTGGPGNNDHNATIMWGCNASSGNLPVNDTETGTTYRPWLEFDTTITFSGGGTTVTPGVLALTTSGFAPSIILGTVVEPGVLSLTATLYEPSVVIGTVLTPDILSLTITTYAPNIVGAGTTVTPGVLSLTLTAYAPLLRTDNAYGGIFLWTAANWVNVNAYLEVYMRATTGTVYARLMDSNNSVVANSEVSTTSTSFQRLRSSALTLTDGLTYRVQCGKVTGDAGEVLGAKLIVVPRLSS